ncbi:beta-galactoside alpha-2,6-sialyltransferase 1-like [Glandiceps talaboti]
MGFRNTAKQRILYLTTKGIHFLRASCILFGVLAYFVVASFTRLPTLPYFKEATCEVNVAVQADSSVLWYPANKNEEVITLPITDFEELSHLHSRIKEKTIPSENFPLQQRVCFLPKEEPWMDKALMFYNRNFDSAEEVVPKFQQRVKGKTGASASEVACRLKAAVPIDFVHPEDSPFHELGIGRYFPEDSFLPKDSRIPYKSCAVVTSSGSLHQSQLGEEIDSHDAVLRFNVAPLKGFERDVGSKTTIRIANNKVFRTDDGFKDLEELKDSEILISWREGPYNANLNKWYKDSKSVFCSYAKWHYKHPESPVYVMRLESVWKLWDVIQEFSDEELSGFPPTSGFMGIHLLLNLCETVDIYGYIPLSSKEKFCYYYKDCCFFCGWNFFNDHPVNAEKRVALMMKTDKEEDYQNKVKITLQGYSKYDCDKTNK